MDMTLTLTSSLMRLVHSKKNRWCCLRVFVSLITGKPTKICFMVVNKTIYGNNGDVPDKLLNMFLSSSPGIRNHMNWQAVALMLSSHSLIELSLTITNSSSTIVWPDRFNVPCPNCLQWQPFMTKLELDGMTLILIITSQFLSKQMKWVMWYNKKKIYNTTSVGRGSHHFDDNEEY